MNKPTKMDFSSDHCSHKLPLLIEQLLLITDVAFVTGSQVLQNHFGIFLVGLSDGSLIGLKLDDVHHFV